MGQVLMRAGGGKVTVDGLTPEAMLAGETVVVKQGNKVLKKVRGTAKKYLPLPIPNVEQYCAFVGPFTGTEFDVTNYNEVGIEFEETGNLRVYYLSLRQNNKVIGTEMVVSNSGHKYFTVDVSDVTGNVNFHLYYNNSGAVAFMGGFYLV